MRTRYIRHIAALTADELELFVDSWMTRKKRVYQATEVWAGPGDKGRDVVGYLTPARLEGPWHLFQCKQLNVSLGLPEATKELGKVFYQASIGTYALPEAYFFVAPRNVSRPVQELVAHPERLRQAMIDNWDAYCAKRIVDKATIPLSLEIRSLIEGFDFSNVHIRDVIRILKDDDIDATLVEFFGHDPGDYIPGITPDDVQEEETGYLRQLIEAYGERAGVPFQDTAAVLEHGEFRSHLGDQRTRYFQASFFKRHYRDNTPEQMLIAFEDEVYHGVVDTHREDHRDTLVRVDKVMKQAVSVQPSGILGRYAKIPVRQGICHHFANEDRLPWKR